MRIIIKPKFEAQGLIEAILAILIAGIAVVALMAVTTRSLGQVARNEISDQIAQESVLGSNMVDHLVEIKNSSDPLPGGATDLFVDSAFEGNCYHLDGNLSNPVIPPTPVCTLIPDIANSDYQIIPRNCLGTNQIAWDRVSIDDKDSSPYDFSGTMFRILCIDERSLLVDQAGVTDDPLLFVGRIYTGTRSCQEIDYPVNNLSEKDEPCVLNEYTAVHPLTRP